MKYESNRNINIRIPKEVDFIIKKLEENGFEAFAVGGCVRDTIIGRKPQDWDITTSAHPLQVKDIFHRTIDTGLQHGTVTVMLGRVGYEVTTYRIDGEYVDSRHPESVQYTTNLIEDLKRRDFTINAMAYNPKFGIVDAFDGMGDIERKVIKCVNDPKERFSEDALRILRAVRFSAQLGFEIEEKTMQGICRMAPTLENISAERICSELEKLILSDHPEKLITAYEMGITKVILPEFDAMMECEQDTPYHMYNVGEHTIKVMQNVEKTRIMRFAALFHDVAKPDVHTHDTKSHFKRHAIEGVKKTEKIMRRLKMDNKTINVVKRLVECHDDRPVEHKRTEEQVRRSVHKIGKDIYPLYLQLANADFAGKSAYGREKGYDDYLYTVKVFEKIINENQCTSSKELKITGKEIIELGIGPGPEVGDVIDELLDRVLHNPDLNDNKKLKEMVVQKSRKQA